MTQSARPGSDLYDDPSFFARYQHMRAAGAGLNDELEQPALARLLLPVHGASVVELGCGDGALARRLAAAGAGMYSPWIPLSGCSPSPPASPSASALPAA
jgi:hypothetical protein